MEEYPLTAERIKQEFKRAGIRFVVALPDRVTSHYLLKGLIADSDFHVVQVCKEDEGISVCSGLYAAGHKSVMMMQYTGFLDSINAIRGVAVEGHFPVCMAKTQYSFSTDPNKRGAPTGHIVPIRELRLSAGAEFIVVVTGEIMTMPGLPSVPAANSIRLDDEGQIQGLF